MGMRDMNGILEKIEQDVEHSNLLPLARYGHEKPAELFGECIRSLLAARKHMHGIVYCTSIRKVQLFGAK